MLPVTPLTGKKLYIPPMAYGSAQAFAAAPPSGNRTREPGARRLGSKGILRCYQ